jgi:pimeloyl-ACP methyl ester carboxylesterase
MAAPAWLAHDDCGGGPAVVLIHGHPFDRSMWKGQLRPLSARFRAIAPDLRGYGQSPATAGTVTMAQLAADVWALLDGLGVSSAAPVGLSMGGLVAIEMAIARPRAVWALGLIASTAEPATVYEHRTRLALADRVEAVGLEPLVESMAPRLFGPGVSDELVESVVAMMRASNPVGAAAALRGRADRPDYRVALHAVAVPAFVCTGTDDVWSTAAVTAELVASLPAATVLSLPGVGHMPNLEAPERFNEALAAFLEAAAGDAVA